jgi:3,4-dihydroxy 2-butanone 4-phosphate synthase/GTP cyclohydrolase II
LLAVRSFKVRTPLSFGLYSILESSLIYQFHPLSSIIRQASAILPTRLGEFEMIAFAERSDEPMPQVALVAAGIDYQRPVLVRIHSECMTGDIFGSLKCDCGAQLQAALSQIIKEKGILLYLRQEGRGIGLINKLKAYRLQEKGLNTLDANTHLGFEADSRQYQCAIEMLLDLGVQQIRLLTNNPDKVAVFEGSPVELVERVPLVIPAEKESAAYLQAKKELMGHLL